MKDLLNSAVVAYQVVSKMVVKALLWNTMTKYHKQGDDDLADEENYEDDEDDIPSDDE